MDWKAIRDKGLAMKDRVVDLSGQAADKAFTALEKAAGHAYDGLKKTPVAIKNGAELDEARGLPLVVVLVLGKEDAVSKAVLVRMPVVLKDAWLYSAAVKIVLAPEAPELLPALPVSEAPGLLVYRKGELEKTLSGDAVLEFVKAFDLSKQRDSGTVSESSAPEGASDPLSEAVAPAAKSASNADGVPAAAEPAPSSPVSDSGSPSDSSSGSSD